MALAAARAVVLADEPTGELDERTGELVLDLLEQIRDEGAAVLTATHERQPATCGAPQAAQNLYPAGSSAGRDRQITRGTLPVISPGGVRGSSS